MSLTSLDLNHSDVTNLAGLELSRNLRILAAENNSISELAPLMELRQLEVLSFWYPIAKLPDGGADLSCLQFLPELKLSRPDHRTGLQLCPPRGITKLAPGARRLQLPLTVPRQTVPASRISTHGKDGLWAVDPMISILATPDKLPLARSMTQHMIDSWEENPQWKQYQERITHMGLAQIKADFGRFMQQMAVFHQQREAAMNQQVAQFESRQQAQATQVSSWGNMLTGLTNLYDPTTGTQFQVFSRPKANYYMNGYGVKINSNLDPGNGFHQVQNFGL